MNYYMYKLKSNQTGEDKDKQVEKTTQVVQIVVPANIIEQLKQIDEALKTDDEQIKEIENHKKPLELKRKELTDELELIKKETKLKL